MEPNETAEFEYLIESREKNEYNQSKRNRTQGRQNN